MTKQFKYSFHAFTNSKDAVDTLLNELAPYMMQGEASFSTNSACGILIRDELTEEVTSVREQNRLMKEYQKNIKNAEKPKV